MSEEINAIRDYISSKYEDDDLMNRYGNDPDYIIPDSMKKILSSKEFKELQERLEKQYKSRKAASSAEKEN